MADPSRYLGQAIFLWPYPNMIPPGEWPMRTMPTTAGTVMRTIL